ncbi:progranulin-like [Pholidichthys leucotaenia]
MGPPSEEQSSETGHSLKSWDAVCCDDHKHCCPNGTTCDPTSTSCDGPSGSTPVTRKTPAFTMTTPTTMETSTQTQETNPIQEEENEEPREEPEEEEGSIQLGSETTCPPDTTSCYMASSKKCGCCPLHEAVCCPDGLHCCPNKYKCDQNSKLCIKGDVVIPWYTKIPATVGIQANPSSVNCDGAHQCPEHTTCCRLFTGEQLCCPLRHAVCCHDQKHCCPLGYSCHAASSSCKKLIRMQVDSIPLTQVFLPEPPSALTDIKCDDETYCGDEETCCRTSSTTWGCCPFPNV